MATVKQEEGIMRTDKIERVTYAHRIFRQRSLER